MIREPLLIVAGGTTESREAAEALVEQGYRVLWSQATDAPFQLQSHPRLIRRIGRLTEEGWAEQLRTSAAAAVVDAAHPHAIELRATLRRVTARLGVPLLRLSRGASSIDASALVVSNHVDAARTACELGQRILVTVGTRQLGHYVEAARAANAVLFARVLDVTESHQAVAFLGFDQNRITWARGPFGVEQNLQHLQQCAATVLVTKDSGMQGGFAEKFEAARKLGCRVVVVARPKEPPNALHSVEELIEQLRSVVPWWW